MKSPIIISMIYTLVCFLVLFTIACSSTGSEFHELELMDLQFTRSAYSSDQALVLRAIPNPDLDRETLRKNPLTIQLTSSNGTSTTENLSSWDELTDEEMVEAIRDGGSLVALSIKEADQASALNSEGIRIRSEVAMNTIIDWVENHEKLDVYFVSDYTPTVIIELLEDPTVEIVNQIRNHENVELLEPDGPIMYESESFGSEIAEDFAAVIIPKESFTYSANETITAVFQQADGTVLEASVMIAE